MANKHVSNIECENYFTMIDAGRSDCEASA